MTDSSNKIRHYNMRNLLDAKHERTAFQEKGLVLSLNNLWACGEKDYHDLVLSLALLLFNVSFFFTGVKSLAAVGV